MTGPPLFLDACCAINLLASGAARSILRVLPHSVFVARVVVEEEVLHVRVDPEKEERDTSPHEREIQTRTLEPWVAEGLVEIAEPETEDEEATFVNLALQLDDGEAMTGALALHRSGILATDDKKAIRVICEHMGRERVRRTSQLVKHWAGQGRSNEQVRAVLQKIEEVGSFQPPSDDPEIDWWRQVASFEQGG